MRISDWSSDVCSSELEDVLAEGLGHELGPLHELDRLVEVARQRRDAQGAALGGRELPDVVLGVVEEVVTLLDARSEERRVGKELSVRVDLVGRRIIKKKNHKHHNTTTAQKKII